MLNFTGAPCLTPTPTHGNVSMPFSRTFGSTANVTCKKGYTKNGATVQIKCDLLLPNINYSLWTGPECEGQYNNACVLSVFHIIELKKLSQNKIDLMPFVRQHLISCQILEVIMHRFNFGMEPCNYQRRRYFQIYGIGSTYTFAPVEVLLLLW